MCSAELFIANTRAYKSHPPAPPRMFLVSHLPTMALIITAQPSLPGVVMTMPIEGQVITIDVSIAVEVIYSRVRRNDDAERAC